MREGIGCARFSMSGQRTDRMTAMTHAGYTDLEAALLAENQQLREQLTAARVTVAQQQERMRGLLDSAQRIEQALHTGLVDLTQIGIDNRSTRA